MATPIAEYLVALGFRLDSPGAKRFAEAIQGTTREFAGLAETSTAAAAAVGLAVEKISAQYSDLFFLSQRTGASVSNLQAMAFGFSQIGLSAGEAKGVIDAFSLSLRTPGMVDLLQRLGVRTQGRDATQQHHDLIRQLSKGPDYVAFSYLEHFGESPLQYIQEKNNLDAYDRAQDRHIRMLKEAGVDVDGNKEKWRAFGLELGNLNDDFDILQQKIAQDFLVPAEFVVKALDNMIHLISDADKATGGWATTLGSLASSFIAVRTAGAAVAYIAGLFGVGAGAKGAAGGGLGFLGGLAAATLDYGDASGNSAVSALVKQLDAAHGLSNNPADVLSGLGIAPGASGGGIATQATREAFIRQRALIYGIDPDVAVRVARSEGLNNLADSQGGLGDRGTSGGDFQLHVGGGLGDAFRNATGLDPLDPRNWAAADDFALRQAATGGWRPWHGAARAHIGEFEGIGTSAPLGADIPRGGGGGDMTIAPQTSITVNGGADPQTTANYVLRGQDMVTANILRNAGDGVR